ncbi:telomere repeats-binding bouquet formation protein 2 isoform X2 [Kryptolebias marmoratus]|uniref:telomere repeats-binding bouquet formation protein 2 isoform X2 n=1 Tax=Kryptolebias marmoratus TaxID=37003 RepID=UPI0007F8CA71|nr:telomere repeats-binding bouquet formation protein 2 isoform X2 [Kryptolebias marmoratus]
MFKSKSAWFSSSVPKDYLNFWVLEGGTVTGWRTADYLFSADATCPDTLRIFYSKDYIWNKVTVFHCLFLSTCEKRQSVKSVCIGHFVLPPASVQDEVRKVVGRLIWECEDEQAAVQEDCLMCLTEGDCREEVRRMNSEPLETDSSRSEAPLWDHLRSPVCGYVSMDNLQKYSGDLCDVHPWKI